MGLTDSFFFLHTKKCIKRSASFHFFPANLWNTSTKEWIFWPFSSGKVFTSGGFSNLFLWVFGQGIWHSVKLCSPHREQWGVGVGFKWTLFGCEKKKGAISAFTFYPGPINSSILWKEMRMMREKRDQSTKGVGIQQKKKPLYVCVDQSRNNSDNCNL